MHYTTPHYSASAYHSCYPYHHSPGCGVVIPMLYPVPVPSYHPASCSTSDWGGSYAAQTMFPQEISVDTTNSLASALIGGTVAAALTLEYLPDSGASTPTVKVTVEHDGSTSTWEETAIPQGGTASTCDAGRPSPLRSPWHYNHSCVAPQKN